MSKVYTYLAAIGAALLGLFTIFYKGKSEGKQEVEQEHKEKVLENVKKAKEVVDDNNKLTNDAVRNELRDKLKRK